MQALAEATLEAIEKCLDDSPESVTKIGHLLAEWRQSREQGDAEMIQMASGVNFEGKAFVRYLWGMMQCQFTPDEARNHGLALIVCAEAAVADGAVFRCLVDRTKCDPNGAAAFVADLRNFRCGLGGGDHGVVDDTD